MGMILTFAVYEERDLSIVSFIVSSNLKLVCLAAYISSSSSSQSTITSTSTPTLLHICSPSLEELPSDPTSAKPATVVQTCTYPSTPSPFFVLSSSSAYDPGNAALSHTTTLVFFRKHLGGPIFDIAAIWEEHTYFEFAARTVAKTMGTMVVS